MVLTKRGDTIAIGAGAGRDCHVALRLAVSVLFVKRGSGGGLELGGPRGTVAGYGVELQQQLPHHSHQRHFARFAPLTQLPVKVSQHPWVLRIEAMLAK